MSEFDGDWTTRQPDGWEDHSPHTELDPETDDNNNEITRRPALVILGIVAASSALAYGVTHISKSVAKDFKPKQTPNQLVYSCPQPTEKSLTDVNRLFTEPVAKAKTEYRQLALDGYERQGSETLPNLWGTTGPELLYYTQPFFEKYKIDVQPATGADKSIGYGMRAPTENEMSSQNMMANVLGLVAGLSDAPPHYVLESGLRHIKLVAGPKKTEFVWDEPHTLYWNINTPEPNADPVPFEFGIALGHFTEDRLCGESGVENDPALKNSSDNLFVSPLAAVKSAIRAKTLDEYNDGKARAQDVQYIDRRAQSSVSVDKAEILAMIAEPAEVAAAMSPDHPLLRAKVLAVLAELYQKQPAVVRRLAVKASHYPYTGPNAADKPPGNRHDPVPKY